MAAAVLEFLREQPLGDGAGAAVRGSRRRDPFADRTTPSASSCSRSTAPRAASGTTVVVTGVETGLVPHRSATTAAARAEEARLLHVAVTRATDRL